MARAVIDQQVAQLLTQRSAWIAASGGLPGPGGLDDQGVRHRGLPAHLQRASASWPGPAGLLQFHQPGAAADGWIEYDARHTPVVTIYGGTAEINRNNIAERHLGLPKARR